LHLRAGQAGAVRLFEVPLTGLEQCALLYRFRILADPLPGPVYAEMWVRIPDRGEFFSRGLDQKVQSAPDWRTVEIPFYLAADQRADQAKLNLVFTSPAAVRLKDIELLAAPVQTPVAAQQPV
jgi:hypothetical protein